MSVTPRPPVVGAALLEIRLRDAAGRPVAATAMKLEADMAHPGMRPVLADARAVAPDRWLADVELSMAGDWVVVVDARLADGRDIERTLPLRGVRPR